MGGIVAEHREYLKSGYESKMILMSGPKTPKTGWIIICRAETIEQVKAFFINDPYALHGAAEHLVTEFSPLMHQEFLKEWI